MTLPQDPYTDRARSVLSLAHECAHEANLDDVCPSHILVALAKGDRGVARMVLESQSVDLAAMQTLIPVPPTRPARQVFPVHLPLTAAATHLIAFGKEEGAKLSLGYYFGTEHLLLGLMRLNDDPATGFLTSQSVTLDAVRAGIDSLLNGSPEADS